MSHYEFIKVVNLSYKTQEKLLFENVNLNLNLGELTILIGDNGSGKTTLGKIIMGIVKSTDGEVVIDGKPIEQYSLAEIGKKIGYCFQNPDKQIFNPTVKDEMTFYFKFTKQEEQDYLEVLKLFNIDHLVDAHTLNLSQGEKQRLALASIFMLNPKYLILDEPSSGLDKENKMQLYNILKELKENQNIGALIISHDEELIKNCADKVYEIKDRGIEIA